MGGQSGLPFLVGGSSIMDYKYIIVAFIFIVFDVVTGVLQALINGTFKSHIMRKGGYRKLCLIVCIAFGVALDYSQTLVDLGFTFPCLKMIACYITFMEIMSIIENLNLAFPGSLPKSLISVLGHAAEENGVKTDEAEPSDDETDQGI